MNLDLCNPLASKAALIFCNPLKLLFGINAPSQHSSISLFWMLWPKVAPAPSSQGIWGPYDISNIIPLVRAWGLLLHQDISRCVASFIGSGAPNRRNILCNPFFGNLEMLQRFYRESLYPKSHCSKCYCKSRKILVRIIVMPILYTGRSEWRGS